MVDSVRVKARSDEATCGYCRAPLDAGRVACRTCGVGLHPGCRDELGRCPTLGCREARKPTATPRRSGAWLVAAGVLGLGVLALGVGFFELLDRRQVQRRREAVLDAEWARWDEEEREAVAARAEAEAAEERAREEARRQALVEAHAALLDTPVGAALVPLEVPSGLPDVVTTPGRALADAACLENGLGLEAGELRRVVTAALLRGVALRGGWSEVRPGDRGRLDLTISRPVRGAPRRTWLRTDLRVARADEQRLELHVQARRTMTERDDDPRGPGDVALDRTLDWTETWTAQALRDVQARLRGARHTTELVEGEEVHTAEALADGTRTRAVWSARPGLLPRLVRVSREEDGVPHEVVAEQLEWVHR